MKIVFWGAEHGCGTTAHMLAVAGMLQVLCPRSDVTVHMQKECGADHAIGVREERRAGRAAAVREERSADRRSCTQQGQKVHFQFYDGGAGFFARREHLLKNADLVVFNLKSRHCCVENFFMGHGSIPENAIVLLGGDCFEEELWRGTLERIYRIDSGQTGWISHNEEFYQALLRGEVQTFIQREFHSPGSFRNEQFLGELKKVAVQILRKIKK